MASRDLRPAPASADENPRSLTDQLCADCRTYFSRWRACPRKDEERGADHPADNYYWWPRPEFMESENSDSPVHWNPYHERPLASVQQSANRGCHFCSILFEATGPLIGDSPTLETDPEEGELRLFVQMSLTGKLLVDLGRKATDIRAGYGRGVLSPQPIAREPCDCPDGTRTVNKTYSTGSPTSFAQILQWLSTCVGTHAQCATVPGSDVRSVPGNRRLPSLLLEITVPDGEVSVRLVRTASLPARPTWVTLSHCWGKGTHLCTTTTNLEEHLQGIALDKLPKTFQHAVEITHRLGQRYLWIDSLCIQQDLFSHWKQECAVMGDIYQCSFLTIAALGAADSSVGCYVERNPLGLVPLHVEVSKCHCLTTEKQSPLCSEDSIRLCVRGDLLQPDRRHLAIKRPHEDFRDYFLTQFSEHRYGKEPLLTRAWALQERLLSPRTVYFGTRIVSYECLVGEAAPEATFAHFGGDIPALPPINTEPPDRHPEHYVSQIHSLKKTFKSIFHNSLSNLPLSKSANTRRPVLTALEVVCQPEIERSLISWCADYWKAVEEYSGLHISHETDRLVAFNGLITRVSAGTGFTSVAGLWKETFLLDLLWCRQMSVLPRVRQSSNQGTFRAPTWSWVSWDAPQGVELMLTKVLSEFQKQTRWFTRVVDVEITGDTQTGCLTGGWAILTGPLMPVEYDYIDEKLQQRYRGRLKQRNSPPTWSTVNTIIFWPDSWDEPSQGQPETTEQPTTPQSPSDLVASGSDLWALLIMVTYGNGKDCFDGYGLVVRKTGKTTDDGREEWKREGGFRHQLILKRTESTIVDQLESSWLHESTERNKEIYLV